MQVVDATAAGDAFRAAFAVALVEELPLQVLMLNPKGVSTLAPKLMVGTQRDGRGERGRGVGRGVGRSA